MISSCTSSSLSNFFPARCFFRWRNKWKSLGYHKQQQFVCEFPLDVHHLRWEIVWLNAPRIWRDFGSALPFQTRVTQTKPVPRLLNEHGSQVKDQGRRQWCHNKHKKFPYRPTRDASLLSGHDSVIHPLPHSPRRITPLSGAHSPSWESNGFSASQEIPHILWNPRVHYRSSQAPATCPYPEPDQSSPLCSHITSWKSILILSPSTRRSSKWYLSLRFPHQNPVYTSPFPK